MEEPKRIERKITLGFKILSGYYLDGVSREKISELGEKADIHWDSREPDTAINEMSKQLLHHQTFKFWSSWKVSIIDVMSDAVALNFLLLMTKDWIRKDRPTNPQATTHKTFQKNGVMLLDRSIYEYITRQWRGSSDSRIASNLQALKTSGELFEPVPDQDWNRLLQSVIDQGMIEGISYVGGVDKSIRLLLLYYYVLRSIDGPTGPTVTGVEVDHIIPQASFASTIRADWRNLCHNMVNLALLPRSENASKGDTPLKNLTDPWLISQVEKYEEISRVDFQKYSDVSQVDGLSATRGQMIKDTFAAKRTTLIEL